MSLIPKRPNVVEPAAKPYAVARFVYRAKLHAGLDKQDRATLEEAREWYERACEYIDQSDALLSNYEAVHNPPDAHVATRKERELAKFYLWWEAFGSLRRRRASKKLMTR